MMVDEQKKRMTGRMGYHMEKVGKMVILWTVQGDMVVLETGLFQLIQSILNYTTFYTFSN